MDRLGREDTTRALLSLADELGARAQPLEIAIVGGAALVLLYGARETTKDVDGFLIGGGEGADLRNASRRVATRLGLPDDWLNDAAGCWRRPSS